MEKEKLAMFTQKIFADMAGAMTAGLCYLGLKTGLFSAMAQQGAMTQQQVIEQSNLHPRYVEEWLKGMVCGGYLLYDAAAQTYSLPDEHSYLLTSEGTDHFAGGLFYMLPSLLGGAPEVANAFKHGGGVSFTDFPEEMVAAIDIINRGNYERRFVSYWLKALPDVVAKLEAGANVLDIGCGVGRVSLILAHAFPNSYFTGIDSHVKSIEQAKLAAKEHGLSSRVNFTTQDLDELRAHGDFDLITACDCLHDMTQPVEVLRQLRDCLKPDGSLFIIEPKVADKLEDNCNAIATMFYGFSVFHCMTQSLAQGGCGLGTCMGPAQTEKLVRSAGFGSFEILDIKSQVNLFYVARR